MGVFAINTHIMNESFVYLWRDSLKSRYYLGFHNGSNPNYICSSKHMMKEYKARPQDFKRRILQVGQREEMAVLERKLLISRKNHFGKRYINLMIPMDNFPRIQWTDEARQEKSIALKGKKKPKAIVEKMSQSQKELWNNEPKRREHQSQITKSRWADLEYKKWVSLKMREGAKGRKMPPITEEARINRSNAIRKWWRLRKLNLQVS